jgi:hypothetical protein
LQDRRRIFNAPVFAGGGEAHFRPAFLRQLQIDPAGRDVDQFAVMIQRQSVVQLGFELLEALGIGAAGPSGRW